MTAGTQGLPRVLSLSEVAERLGMKPPNVAKFLARRGIEPVLAKAQGYFWAEDAIERVKAEREADEARMAADARRRKAALEGPAEREPREPKPRVGGRQAELLEAMLRRPISADDNATRLAIRRLRLRGFVKATRTANGGAVYQLTEAGREVAGRL